MSKKNEPTYEKLSESLSDEEIAESYVLRSTLTAEEKNQAEVEFKKLRMQTLKSMSDEQVLQSELIRMRVLMKDYFKQNIFLPDFSFANQLKKYIDLLNISHTQFAADINIHKTKLSRIINSKENPNIELMYRLEIHSGSMIHATYWYRLYSKKVEEEIKTDEDKRSLESGNVKNELKFKLSA
ncbi:MAG: helix-turn-helix transcriptional regulator [Bacteroidia bacterium]